MRCSKHDYEYEYGVGVCPYCEQERHNREMERAAWEAASLQEERNEAQRERWDRKQKSRNSQRIQDFIAELHETHGDRFVADHYLRLVLAPQDLTGSDVAARLIGEVYAPKYLDEARTMFELQKGLHERIVRERKSLEDAIDSRIYDKRKETRSSGSSKTLFWALVGGAGGFWIASEYTHRWVEFLRWILSIGAAGIGAVIGAAIGAAESSSDSSKVDTYAKEQRRKLEQFDRSFEWFAEQLRESTRLYDQLQDGIRLTAPVLEQWATEDKSVLVQRLQADIDSVSRVRKNVDR